MIVENSAYNLADIRDHCREELSQWEQKISKESGKEIVLVAYEKANMI